MAFDLEDVVSPRGALAKLRELRTLSDKGIDQEAAAKAIASAQSATFTVNAGDEATATLRIEFKDPVTALRPIAREVVIAAVERAGLSLEELNEWRVQVQPQAIELTGALKDASLRQVLTMIAPPNATEDGAAIPEANEAAPASSNAPNAEKSKSYYRSVLKLVDANRARGQSFSKATVWLDRDARAIDELPILGVDSDVVGFGAHVAQTLRTLSGSVKFSQNDVVYRVQSMGYGTGTGASGVINNVTGGGYYGGGYSSISVADVDRMKKAERATLNVRYEDVVRQLNDDSAALRKAMTLKYGIEF